jgi:DNA-binding MarR family transcriptional regulator
MSNPARDVIDGITLALDGEVPELDLAASELARRAIRFASMLEDTLTASLAPWGLTAADYGVLITLRSAGEPYELRPSELKSRLLMTSGGVSGVLNRLASTGLIDRQPDLTDGRSSRVRLTPAGVETANAAVRAWTLAQCDVLRKVPDDVSRQAADALRDVLLALGDTEPPTADATRRRHAGPAG